MRVLFLLALGVSAWGQTVRFSATSGDVALVAAGYKMTLQQPTANGKQVNLEAVSVYCSVACDFTQSANGTAATATAGTVTSLLPYLGRTMNITAWTASNVGAGTASGGIEHLAAASPKVFDLSKLSWGTTGTGTNYTFVVSSITGTVNITVIGSEKQ